MSEAFDPYHRWLGIQQKDQPPNHYRLLGIELFESDPEVIANAADARMGHVRSFQVGKDSQLSQRILNEIAAARICLLHSEKKAEYDQRLRKQLQAHRRQTTHAAGSDRGLPVAQAIGDQSRGEALTDSAGRPHKCLPVAQPLSSGMPVQPASTSTPQSVSILIDQDASALTRMPRRKPQNMLVLASLGGAFAVCFVALLLFLLLERPASGPVATAPSSRTKNQAAAGPRRSQQTGRRHSPEVTRSRTREMSTKSGTDPNLRHYEEEANELQTPDREVVESPTSQDDELPDTSHDQDDSATSSSEQMNETDGASALLPEEVVVEQEPPVSPLLPNDHESSSRTLPPPQKVSKTPPIETAAQLSLAASRCRSAKEALYLYETFGANTSISDVQRESAQRQLPLWSERAGKGFIRFGKRWIAPAEADRLREEARQLVQDAIRLVEVEQGELARQKLLEASRQDPESIAADFLLGLGYALLLRNPSEARKHFAECVARDPNHIASLNNLALAEIRLRSYTEAIRCWEKSLELAPASPEVIQNVGRFLAQASRKRLMAAPTIIQSAGDLYTKVLVGVEERRFEDHVGWLYMRASRMDDISTEDPVDATADSEGGPLQIVGHGSGFVIDPCLILTNRHVIENADGLLVVLPSVPETQFPASVVALPDDPDVDLAVIRCDGVNAPSLPLSPEVTSRRGTEIAVFGFPGSEISNRMPTLRVALGNISGLPSASERLYYFDGVTNPGNSGGPIFDKTGTVLAIHMGRTRDYKMNYGLGIPVTEAISLIAKVSPAFKPSLPSNSLLEWPAIDEVASRSTVLILIQSSLVNIGLPSREASEEWDAYEDPWCMVCNGHAVVPCPNRQCKNGTVGSTRREVVGRNPITGDVIYQNIPIRVDCPTCRGKGVVNCPACHKGLDPGLYGG